MTVSWLTLLFFALTSVAAQDAGDLVQKRPDGHKFQNSDTEEKYYSSFVPISHKDNLFQNGLPVLARIVPITNQNQQNGYSVTGYVYASQMPYYHEPVYTMLCAKENNSNQDDQAVDSDKRLKPLIAKIDELSEKVNVLIDLCANKKVADGIPNNQKNQEKSKVFTPEPTTTPPEDNKPDGTSNTVNVDDFKTANNNVQNSVFQCEGVQCPKSTDSCKVVNRSLEPAHEKIVKTVFCLNKDRKTIKQVEKKIVNPNKGSSLNSSKTYNNNDHSLNAKYKDRFENEMRGFQQQMNNAFGNL